MLEEILEGIRRDNAPTVISRRPSAPSVPPYRESVVEASPPVLDDGFIDWFGTDVSYGFHSYDDAELADILKYKVENCVFDPNRVPTLKLYFYQSTSARNIEVDFNKPHHEKLVKELDCLQDSGPKRQNSLARIRYAAKRIGLRANRGADGRKVLASDLRLVWRDERGNIVG